MTQSTFPTIDPATTTGAELAADLNLRWPAILSQHSGTTRPTGAVSGMIWIDTSGTPIWTLKVYDGAADISLFAVDTTGNTARPSLGAQQLPTVSTFTGDGSTTAFVLSATPVGADALIVTIDGIVQQKTTAWSLGGGAGKTVTFTNAPPNGSAIVVTDLSDTAVLDPSQVATVAGLADAMTTVAADTAAINAVATDLGGGDDIGTVAADIAAVTTAASNIAAIIAAPTEATNAATSATTAGTAKDAALVAQTAAELAETNAVAAQGSAESARDDAETAQTAAEAAETGAAAAALAAAAGTAARAGFRTRFGKTPPAVLPFYLGDTSGVTQTRATVGTAINAGGAPAEVAIDTARIEHDVDTSERLGLLLEPAGTNVARRSNDFGNAYWLLGSNLSRVTGKTDPAGGASASRITATSSGTGATLNYIREAAGPGYSNGVYTFWVRRVTGTGTVKLLHTTNGTSGTDITSLLTEDWQRFTHYGAAAGGYVYFGVGVLTSGDAVDIAFAHCEADIGDVPTSSYIETVASDVTRSTDVATVDLSALAGFRPAGFTLVAEVIIRATDGVIMDIGTGATSEVALDMQSGDLHVTGADSLNITAASGLSVGDTLLIALRVQRDSVAVSVNGATVVTDSSHTLNGDADELQLGANISGSDPMPCVVQQVAFFGPLPDATLEAMSNV